MSEQYLGAGFLHANRAAGHKGHRVGTHRAVAPRETLERVMPFCPNMGITRLANVTGLDRIGIPVVVAYRPNSRSIAVAQGKGMDLESAKASAVMEATESYHAERIDLPLKLGSYNDLRSSHRLVDVAALPRRAGESFNPDNQVLWIEGYDLLTDQPAWLPYDVVHTNYTVPHPAGSTCFVRSTNGLASGNTILEAVAHGLAEVVERDCISLWNQLSPAGRDLTRIGLDSIEDPICRATLKKMQEADMRTAIWDATGDAGVASFYCLTADNLQEFGHSGAGAGCHPTREIALLRAITEAVQVRTNYITGSRDDITPSEYTRSGIAQKAGHAGAMMNGKAQGREFQAVPSQSFDNFTDDIVWMLERLRAVGLEQVIAVDLTKGEFGLPVVRVVVPGLEGPDDHDAYEPGRRARAARAAAT